jgi:hypothetical protein
VGSLIGWAAEVAVAFPLRRFHVLPQPPQIVRTIAWIAMVIFFFEVVCVLPEGVKDCATPSARKKRGSVRLGPIHRAPAGLLRFFAGFWHGRRARVLVHPSCVALFNSAFVDVPKAIFPGLR